MEYHLHFVLRLCNVYLKYCVPFFLEIISKYQISSVSLVTAGLCANIIILHYGSDGVALNAIQQSDYRFSVRRRREIGSRDQGLVYGWRKKVAAAWSLPLLEVCRCLSLIGFEVCQTAAYRVSFVPNAVRLTLNSLKASWLYVAQSTATG